MGHDPASVRPPTPCWVPRLNSQSSPLPGRELGKHQKGPGEPCVPVSPTLGLGAPGRWAVSGEEEVLTGSCMG